VGARGGQAALQDGQYVGAGGRGGGGEGEGAEVCARDAAAAVVAGGGAGGALRGGEGKEAALANEGDGVVVEPAGVCGG
jgi:hypothetical protein